MSQLQKVLMRRLRRVHAAGDVIKRVDLIDQVGFPYSRRQAFSAIDSLELKGWVSRTEHGYVELTDKAPGP